eukprot:318723_1
MQQGQRVDVNETGWIHNLEPSTPSFALYHLGSLKIFKKLTKRTTVPLYLDDISNLARPVTERWLHSIIWMRDPSKGPPIALAEFISANWKSDKFDTAFHVYVSILSVVYHLYLTQLPMRV